MPYMSASVLVSAPARTLDSFNPLSSVYSPSPAALPASRSSSISSWALSSAVAGDTPPPPVSSSSGCSSIPDSLGANDQINCLQTSVRFLQDCRLSLIHIPLDLYPHFVQAILSLVFPESSRNGDGGELEDEDFPSREGSFSDGASASEFLNISVTPVECSVVCSVEAAEKFFVPIVNSLEANLREVVSISKDDFVAIQVDGEGLDAGQRVLDLTSPLALAGVSIFFITTYFSDYILVRAKDRANVVKALERRGFVFEAATDSFVASPSHHRNSSSTSSFNIPPPTPPPTTTLGDLESRTFSTLRKQNVTPEVDRETKLVLCAGRRPSRKGADGEGASLTLGLVKCLIAQPRFLSVTMTDAEPPSLLLQQKMLSLFDPELDILLGNKEDVLIPIILDLRGLPVDSTGIVCGVAGRLVGGTKGETLDDTEAVGMSYLSTARAGTVMVAEDDIERAVAALGM